MNTISTAAIDNRHQQLNIHKQEKNLIKPSPQTQKNTNTTTVAIESLSIKKQCGYDLTNITPKETYKLAEKLYKEGSINLDNYTSMMVRGYNHEYPPGQVYYSGPDNTPFNLLEEVEVKSIQSEDAQDLFNVLSALQTDTLDLQYSSINITI
jgi:hypothetical protein